MEYVDYGIDKYIENGAYYVLIYCACNLSQVVRILG